MSRNESGPRITPDAFDDSYRDRRSPSGNVDLPRGTRLANKYEIQGVLGVGGMGIVFEAVQLEVGRTVAVKILTHRDNDPDMRARFVREAVILSRLQHMHIVSLFDAGLTDSGLRFFVMEYLEGRSLSSVLKSGPLDPRRAVRIVSQICRGLDSAHAAGVIHRDLKPSNVYLVTMERRDPEGFAKILDFGIARFLLVDPEAPGITKASQLVGTPRYMSPEQIRGDALDARSDIYSLGCVAYELITGRPPFVARSDMATIDEHLHRPPPRFAEVNPTLVDPGLEALEEIVRTMLAKKPEARLSAEAVEAALSLWSARAATDTGTRALSRAEEKRAPSGTRDDRRRPESDREQLPNATRDMRGSAAPSSPKANIATPDESASAPAENNEAELTSVQPHPIDPPAEETNTPEVHASAIAAVEVLDEVLRAQEQREQVPTRHAISRWFAMPIFQMALFATLGFVVVMLLFALFQDRPAPSPSIVIPPKAIEREAPVQRISNAVPDEAPAAEREPKAEGQPENIEAVLDAHTGELIARPREAEKKTAQVERRIHVRNVQVERGSIDSAEVSSALKARAKDVTACFERTQKNEHRSRTLRLSFMSSEGSTTIRAFPRDAAAQAFEKCVGTLDPKLALPVSRTRALYIFAADIGPGAEK